MDKRKIKTWNTLRHAVSQIMIKERDLTPYNFNAGAIARTGKIGVSTVQRYARQAGQDRGGGNSPWNLLSFFDDELRAEFLRRRAIQNDVGIGKSPDDFFTRSRQLPITITSTSALA